MKVIARRNQTEGRSLVSDDFRFPRELVVVQVIFGQPLRHKRAFWSGDVGALVETQLGRANHMKVLDKLVELGWLTKTAAREPNIRHRRPSSHYYTRTEKGVTGYRSIATELAVFGIQLN